MRKRTRTRQGPRARTRQGPRGGVCVGGAARGSRAAAPERGRESKWASKTQRREAEAMEADKGALHLERSRRLSVRDSACLERVWRGELRGGVEGKRAFSRIGKASGCDAPSAVVRRHGRCAGACALALCLRRAAAFARARHGVLAPSRALRQPCAISPPPGSRARSAKASCSSQSGAAARLRRSGLCRRRLLRTARERASSCHSACWCRAAACRTRGIAAQSAPSAARGSIAPSPAQNVSATSRRARRRRGLTSTGRWRRGVHCVR
mmetsp:Transcript_39634/g.87026  ORF Transcript_39634/g.87026 Transcript_39634/m.87026 type:complete len:267 (+) Transcript_39634:76-876(+)